MSEPVEIRAPHNTSHWLPVSAAATGDAGLVERVAKLYGKGAEFPALRERAASAWNVSADGFRLDLEAHPPGGIKEPTPGMDTLLMDPWDNAHTRRRDDVAAAFKRSCESPLCNATIPIPAMIRPATLDLDCGPAPDAEKPVVSFVGVASRPSARAQLIAEYEASEEVDFRVVKRDGFRNPDAETFMRVLRESHIVLCPVGVGRFSFRFFETLAAGRIPVLPGMSQTLPRELQLQAFVLSSGTSPSEVAAWWRRYGRERVGVIATQNRSAWIECASPWGAAWHMAESLRWNLETLAPKEKLE